MNAVKMFTKRRSFNIFFYGIFNVQFQFDLFTANKFFVKAYYGTKYA